EETAGSDVAVEVGQTVGPGLTLDDHRVAGETGPLAVHGRYQYQEEGPVEQEAPAFPQDPLVGSERRRTVGRADPEVPAAQHFARASHRLFRGGCHGELRVL